ncbi:MAG TPA: tetratricopeptide repeat protein, partial [bacterium]|nr:tetratricopeptide repeat protein [bacterium]
MRSIEELVFTAALLEKTGVLAEGGVAVLSSSGGMGELAADYAQLETLRLPALSNETLSALREILPPMATPANPLDLTGAVINDLALFTRCMDAMQRDPAVSVLVCVADVPTANNNDWAPFAVGTLQAIGQCYLHEENFTEAIAAFEQALDLVSPGHWLFEDLKTSLINVYQDMGDLAGFEKYLLAKLEQAPSAVEYRNLLAEVYIRLNRWDRAEQEYRAVLERDPRQPKVYENLIALYGRMKQPGQAVALFEKLIELYPTETDYLRRLGEFYQAQGQADLAKATWRRVVKADSPASVYADLAGWFESYEYPAEAMAAYGEALARGKNKEWTFRLAVLKFQDGKEEEGVKLALSVLDPPTSQAKEYAEAAGLLQAQNHPREALDLLKTAVEKDPAALDIRQSYAKGLMQLEQFDPALSQYQYLAGQSENEFLREQGEDGILDVYKATGVLDEKQHAWETQLAAAPDSLELLKTLARVYSRTGHKEKAIPLYRRLAEREPENIEHLRVLARQYLQAKQYDEAIAAYRDLIRKDKTRLRAYSQDLLSIYLALDLKDEAVRAAEEITGAAPSDPETHLSLAQVYNTYGRAGDALREFRNAIRLKPEEKGYYEQYGEALAAAGRWGEAAEVFRKIMDLAQTDDSRRQTLRRLALITLRQGHVEDLIHDYEQRIYATPKRASAYLDLAAVCMEAGRPQRAIQVLEDGLNSVEDQTGLLQELIRSSYVYQDVQRVKRYHEQLLAATGRPSLQDYEMLGKVYLQTGDTQRALELWKKIAEENPADARTLIKLAGLYEDSGFTGEALRAMGRAVELEPANCKQRIAYALALARDDRNTEAIDQLLALLEMGDKQAASPLEALKSRVLARNKENVLEPSTFLYNRRNPESFGMKTYADYQLEAVELMTEVAKNSVGIDYVLKKYFDRLQKNPQDTAALRDLTQIHITLENNPAAREANQTLRSLLPNDLDTVITGARIEAMMYHFEEAAALLSQAIEIQPRQKKQF